MPDTPEDWLQQQLRETFTPEASAPQEKALVDDLTHRLTLAICDVIMETDTPEVPLPALVTAVGLALANLMDICARSQDATPTPPEATSPRARPGWWARLRAWLRARPPASSHVWKDFL